MTTTTTRRQHLEAAVEQVRADAAAGVDPFANIPNAGPAPIAEPVLVRRSDDEEVSR